MREVTRLEYEPGDKVKLKISDRLKSAYEIICPEELEIMTVIYGGGPDDLIVTNQGFFKYWELELVKE